MAHLPSDNPTQEYRAEPDEITKGMTVDQMERVLIEQALRESKGNRKEAAAKLGIGERTLYRKIKRYKLT